MLLPSPDRWSSPTVTGQVFPPCTFFTLTTVGEKRAALYGGWDGSKRFNHLFIVELGRHSVVSNCIVSHSSWSCHCSARAVITLCTYVQRIMCLVVCVCVCVCVSQENKATNTGPHIIIPIYSVLA